MEVKNIAILTSGGDCQGMNTTLNIVVRIATMKGLNVYGVKQGYKGLYNKSFIKLTNANVENISSLGGTILKTARFPEFKEEEVVEKCAQNLQEHNIDALIVIGGDGSFKGAKALIDKGVNVIAIPGTIDNDLRYTDKCLGFDTAVNNASDYIQNVKQTMSALDRGVIIEVMGRYCGDIALYSAAATACDILAVPEKPTSEDELIAKIKESISINKKAPVVVIAEKLFDVKEISKRLNEETNTEFKYSVVGYIQRGGAPSVYDKILAMQFGVRAVELITKGIFNKAIGIKGNNIFEINIDDALHCEYNYNYELLNLFYLLNTKS